MKLFEISFEKLKSQVENFLKKEFSKSDILFSPASPFGQILNVINSMFSLSMLYLKNSLNQFDLSNANSNNEKIIRNLAVISGHNVTRNISATGTLKLSLKSNSDISSISGGKLVFRNKTTLKNKTNGLEYSLNLGTETITYNISNYTSFSISIIQGKWENRVFTGTGEQNQTFQVNLRSLQKDIEFFNYEVFVNGQMWQKKEHIYDILPNENSYIVKTSFGGGIDIIFGNGSYGSIPTIGSYIQVFYLVSDGSKGSIFRRTPNDWLFLEQPTNSLGAEVDVATIFDINIETDINFGADRETLAFTKSVIPMVGKNKIVALPSQYEFVLKRLGIFTHVSAYSDNGVVRICATPNIKLFKNKNSNYFSISTEAFVLSQSEKNKIDRYFKESEFIFISNKYTIDSPILSYYIINIFVIIYNDVVEQNVYNEIYSTISDYFLDEITPNRISRSYIISKLNDIDGIYSVDVSFISRKNEDYHRDSLNLLTNRNNVINSKENISSLLLNENYDNNKILGIDPILGDIVYEPSEIPIIRGGWFDRNNIYYSDDINETGLKTINIITKSKIDRKNKQ